MRELFIRKLIKLVEQSDIDSLEVSSWGRRVKIMKNRGGSNGQAPPAALAAHAAPIVRTEPRRRPWSRLRRAPRRRRWRHSRSRPPW